MRNLSRASLTLSLPLGALLLLPTVDLSLGILSTSHTLWHGHSYLSVVVFVLELQILLLLDSVYHTPTPRDCHLGSVHRKRHSGMVT